MLSGDSRSVTRKRYPIGVKSIVVSRQKFKKTGGLSSSYYSLPAGLYACESSSSIFPRKKTPSHGITQIHVDKTKVVPRHYKYKHIEE